MATETNPLLISGTRVSFDAIDVAHIEPAIQAGLDAAKAGIDAIASGPADSYDGVLEALDRATEPLDTVMAVVGHLEDVQSSDALRAVYNRLLPEVDAFYASIPLNDSLWAALSRFKESAAAGALEGVKARHLKKTLEDFRREGAELAADAKKELADLTRSLSDAANRFGQNLVDATAEFVLEIKEESELAGLPPSARAAAREEAKRRGLEGHCLTLQAPSLVPALTYLEHEPHRKTLYTAYHRRATGGERDNAGLIGEILRLRNRRAQLLGYADFSDFVLADRMAGRGDRADAFVAELRERAAPAFRRENEAIEAFARKQGLPTPIAPWSMGFVAEKMRRAALDFDPEALRPYFPLEQVLSAAFALAERIFGVTVRPDPDAPVWHSDVRAFALFEGDARVGNFALDLHPRPEKRGGAWMNPLFFARGGEPHFGVICGNMTGPIGSEPALLTHDEVCTVLHEFGHLLHHLLTKVPVRSLAGTNVAWDFVELPSQILENWAWTPEWLSAYARHYQTGAALPEEEQERLLSSRTFREATATMRQLGFASLDLDLHRRYVQAPEGDVVRYAADHLRPFSPVDLPDDYGFICGFHHLFGSPTGYASGYYSYKWAEVLDADAFERFSEEGVFSPSVGAAFRQTILECGDAAPPDELYRRFRGREPSVAALLRRSGLEA